MGDMFQFTKTTVPLLFTLIVWTMNVKLNTVAVYYYVGFAVCTS